MNLDGFEDIHAAALRRACSENLKLPFPFSFRNVLKYRYG